MIYQIREQIQPVASIEDKQNLAAMWVSGRLFFYLCLLSSI